MLQSLQATGIYAQEGKVINGTINPCGALDENRDVDLIMKLHCVICSPVGMHMKDFSQLLISTINTLPMETYTSSFAGL